MNDENRRHAADDFTLRPNENATLPPDTDAGSFDGVAALPCDFDLPPDVMPSWDPTVSFLYDPESCPVEDVFVEGNEIAVFDADGERVGTITVGERVPAETSWHEAFRVHFEKDEDHGN